MILEGAFSGSKRADRRIEAMLQKVCNVSPEARIMALRRKE
jgi:hypothetical protein